MFDILSEILSQSWIRHSLLACGILLLLRKYAGNFIQQVFFAKVYNALLGTYHQTCYTMKKQHLESMKHHKSADPELRKKGGLRILEIGPGPGYNFEFYPPNSELTVVEVNPFFEDQFFKKQADHQHIKMKRFVVGFAEDMKSVPDNSVDIVVSTMVLCSVRSVEGALKEIHRILVPGGKYYYWEHIREFTYFWILFVQHLLSYTIYDMMFGCQLNRKSDEIIKANKAGFSNIDQQLFRTPQKGGLHAICIFHSAHVKGIATK